MITLYTAIGRYILTGKKHIIIVGQKEYMLDIHELIIWSTLAFRILTYDELKSEYYEQERELHVLCDLDFDHYIRRLKNRNLIAVGKDCIGTDALYDLLQNLQIHPISKSFGTKLLTCFKLWICNGLPIWKAMLLFSKTKLEDIEKEIFSLITEKIIEGSVTTRDIIKKYDPKIESRISEMRYPIISAVANLYLKQYITFQ